MRRDRGVQTSMLTVSLQPALPVSMLTVSRRSLRRASLEFEELQEIPVRVLEIDEADVLAFVDLGDELHSARPKLLNRAVEVHDLDGGDEVPVLPPRLQDREVRLGLSNLELNVVLVLLLEHDRQAKRLVIEPDEAIVVLASDLRPLQLRRAGFLHNFLLASAREESGLRLLNNVQGRPRIGLLVGTAMEGRHDNDGLDAISGDVVGCRRCPRLVRWRERVAREKKRAFADEAYWGRPVPAFGDSQARLFVIGLAPAAHGGNRTGRML